MQRERATSEPIPADVTEKLADRLHHLSMAEAERVLERAIALQSEAEMATPNTIDTEMLGRIAAELQVDPAHLRQALAEELLRLDAQEPGWLDRLIGPEGVAAQAVVSGRAAQVRAAIDNWLATHEGLRKRSETVNGTRWERDPHLATAARMALNMTQGSGRLRGVDGVTTTVRPATDTHQLVRIEADTGKLRRRSVLLFAAVALLGGLVTVGGTVDGFGWQDVAAGAAVTAVGAAGVLLGIRMWVNRIEEAVGRAVDAFANPNLVGYTGLAGLIGRFLGGSTWMTRR
ncbi:MAG TPA: hypothetical protein VIV08_01130 [Acidimicrobiia bacterium]